MGKIAEKVVYNRWLGICILGVCLAVALNCFQIHAAAYEDRLEKVSTTD